MTIPGAGGQVPPRVDQGYQGSQGQAVVAPGALPVLRVTKIIVSGAGQGIYTYSGTPAAGNLIETAGISAVTTDQFGNNVLAGHSTYGAGFATSVQAGDIQFYTGSLAGGWTFYGDIEISLVTSGQLILNFTSIGGAINVPQAPPSGPLSAPGAYNVGWGTSVVNCCNNIISQLTAAGIF